MNIPKLDFQTEDMQRVVERLHLAKWISGPSLVSFESIRFKLTDRGHANLEALAKTIKTLDPKTYNLPEPRKSRLKATGYKIKFLIQLAWIGRKLRKPRGKWSDGEIGALVGLAAGLALGHPFMFADKKLGGTPPQQKASSPLKRW